MELLKIGLTDELRKALAEWHELEINPYATMRDYARMREKIQKITDDLSEIERKEKP